MTDKDSYILFEVNLRQLVRNKVAIYYQLKGNYISKPMFHNTRAIERIRQDSSI